MVGDCRCETHIRTSLGAQSIICDEYENMVIAEVFQKLVEVLESFKAAAEKEFLSAFEP
ncbi:MAG: hypothetical protein NC930_04070 [Candidatus Omnitrophica bacterium]|nr:hypothetical protein [Candidatus Omnitrophota bacterium]